MSVLFLFTILLTKNTIVNRYGLILFFLCKRENFVKKIFFNDTIFREKSGKFNAEE